MHIRNQKDFWSGVMFATFGVFFAIIGTQYTFGTAERMGPGYFPTVLGVILIGLGIVIALGAMARRAPPEKVGAFDWPTLLFILGPIMLFGLLLNTLGLMPCLLMLIAVSSCAGGQFNWKATLCISAFLIAVCLLVFVYALKLQFRLWPAFLGI